MKNKIHDAFQQIHAEESLKHNTKAFLREQRETPSRPSMFRRRFAVLVSACLFFLAVGFGGWRIYFTPTASVSIDINPSLELSVNRFNKVLAVTGYNSDGEELASSLQVKYMDCEDAIDEIVASDRVKDLLSGDEVLTITVSGENTSQCRRIYSHAETSTKESENTYCYMADHEDTEEAHHLGLSSGKYQAFLRLQALGSDITAEEVKDMTMKEIHDLIHSLSGEDDESGQQHHSGQQKNRQNTSTAGTHHQETHTASTSRHHQNTQSTSSGHHRQNTQNDSGENHSQSTHNSRRNHHE